MQNLATIVPFGVKASSTLFRMKEYAKFLEYADAHPLLEHSLVVSKNPCFS